MVKAIDYWVHAFTPELARRYGLEYEDCAVPTKLWHMEESWKGHSVEEFVNMMDEAGIEKVLINSTQMWSFPKRTMGCEVTVKEIIELVNKRPDRFVGMYGINPYNKMDGVRELERTVRDYGWKAAHLHTYGYERPVNHRDLYPFYAKCVELDIPVVIQVGHTTMPQPNEMARPMLLEDIALYFTELRIVGSHLGYPWTEELIALAEKHPNIYIGTAGWAPRRFPKSIVSYMKRRPGKVLFGSDWPMVQPRHIAQVEDLNLTEEAKAQFLREVAIKVFKL